MYRATNDPVGACGMAEDTYVRLRRKHGDDHLVTIVAGSPQTPGGARTGARLRAASIINVGCGALRRSLSK
jgi:hypothetical protein